MKYGLYQSGYDDAMNGEPPYSDLNEEYMNGYTAGMWDFFSIEIKDYG